MSILSMLFKKESSSGTSLVLDPNGMNSIGGKASIEIQLPELDTSPMVYLGCISKKEDQLPLLDFDLHLICPIFIDLQSPIFLDYSVPENPTIIRDNVSTNFNQYFDDIPNTAYIEYEEQKFSFKNIKSTKVKVGVHDVDMIPGKIGHSGTPNWIHNEAWPNCPRTGNRMEFLFQLGDLESCTTKIGQDILDQEYLDPYLNFGHGYLYVFFEPESKVIAYLNQL